MKQQWQWEQDALDKLGFCGTNGSQDREVAVNTVISLLKEIDRLKAGHAKAINDVINAYS